MSRYPPVRHLVVLSVVALPLSQFLIYPLTAAYSARLGLVAAELVLLWALSLSARRGRWSSEDVLLLNATAPGVLPVAAVTAAGAAVVVAQFDLVCAQLLRDLGMSLPPDLQRDLLELQLVRDAGDLVPVAASVVVAPGLCEEAYFRGFALTSLAARRGGPAAVVGSAALFAVTHYNPWQLPALFLFGLFLGVLVVWTHSLYPAIVAHMVNNALSAAGVNLRAHTGLDLAGAVESVPLPVLAVATAALVLGLRFLARQTPPLPLIVPDDPPPPASCWPQPGEPGSP